MAIEEPAKLYLTKNWIGTLFIYYVVLFLAAVIALMFTLLSEFADSLTIFRQALLGSCSIALSSASIAYIRKLYKLCFTIRLSDKEQDHLFPYRVIATAAYFILRPLMAVLFAVLIVIIYMSGMVASSSQAISLSPGFIYITMITSFYAGFLTGEFIERIEAKGKLRLKSAL